MMTRTILLLTVFLFAELFISSDTPLYAQSEEQLLPDPGVVSYTFRNQFQEDVSGTLDIIRDMGFTNIEFSSLFGKSPSEMRELLDERGLICTSYGVSYDDLVYDTDRVAEDATILGAKYVRVAWIPHDAPFDIEDARRAIADFNEAGKTLREQGLHFSYHNHGYEFSPYEDGTLFDYIVQNSDPDYVNFEMDVFWVAHPGHDPVEILKTYPDRFTLVHLKDLKEGASHDYSGRAPAEYDVPLGTGQVDFQAFLEAAQNSSIEYFYIEDESPDVLTRVPESREYIMSLVQED